MILQILQRLIPINDTTPHTICQDYGDGGKGRSSRSGGRDGGQNRERSRGASIRNNKSKDVLETLPRPLTCTIRAILRDRFGNSAIFVKSRRIRIAFELRIPMFQIGAYTIEISKEKK